MVRPCAPLLSEVHVTPARLSGRAVTSGVLAGGEKGFEPSMPRVTRLTVFETDAFNRSATSQRWRVPHYEQTENSSRELPRASAGDCWAGLCERQGATVKRVPGA